MSESTSTPLPISASTSGDDGDLTEDHLPADHLTDGLDLGFDGVEDILRCWRRRAEGGQRRPSQSVVALGLANTFRVARPLICAQMQLCRLQWLRFRSCPVAGR